MNVNRMWMHLCHISAPSDRFFPCAKCLGLLVAFDIVWLVLRPSSLQIAIIQSWTAQFSDLFQKVTGEKRRNWGLNQWSLAGTSRRRGALCWDFPRDFPHFPVAVYWYKFNRGSAVDEHHTILVVWNMNFIVHIYIYINIWDVILPTDELIFFKMVIAPPTNVRQVSISCIIFVIECSAF
jgi:hypothetical protein